MDGDLGPYDQLDVRLVSADTIILLDFPLLLCAWRAMRRSRERTDFWLWLTRTAFFVGVAAIAAFLPGTGRSPSRRGAAWSQHFSPR